LALPLLLAGPILRRVETNLVTVWVALSQPARVTLSVWEGLVAAGTDGAFATSVDPETVNTRRIGERLHLGLLTVRLPESSAKSWMPERPRFDAHPPLVGKG
jgi:hypothetical protein